MSERLYAWILRLYPSRFRNAFGDEALQLYRDRAHDESGLLGHMRLWIDLIYDLAVSLPSEYRANTQSVAVSSSGQAANVAPLFGSLRVETLSLQSLFFGGLASAVVCGSILSLLGPGRNQAFVYSGHFRPSPGSADTIPARPSDITISCTPEKPVSGSTVRITVTVTSEDRPAPTGKVRIYDGVTVLSLSELQSGAVTVTRKLPYTPTHLIRATYLGDRYHDTISSTEPRQ